MKRTLVALAVAGAFLAPAAAMADGSGVVLSGLIHGDIGFGQETRPDGTKAYESQPNIGTFATRWGIDGTEDLGWAKAIFGLAMDQQFAGNSTGGGTNTNNNNVGDLNNRNSYLGLTGGFGTIKIGQNEHQYEIQQILQDPDPASENTFSTLSLMTNYGLCGTSRCLPGFTRRDAQSVWYTSPNFGGVTVDLAYITPAGRKIAGTNPSGMQGAVMWKSAFGLSLYGALAQYNDEDVSADNDDNKNQAARLGVGYGTELFQVDVAGEQLQFKDNAGTFLGAAGDKVKRTNFMVSGALNLGQHHIRAAVSLAQKAKFNGTTIDDSAARMFLVGYAYTLSKRTEFQVNYGKVDNKNDAQYNVRGAGNDADRFGVGIRHTF